MSENGLRGRASGLSPAPFGSSTLLQGAGLKHGRLRGAIVAFPVRPSSRSSHSNSPPQAPMLLFGAWLGARVLNEGAMRQRMFAAALIVIGVTALALG
jgi:hypothetical protein